MMRALYHKGILLLALVVTLVVLGVYTNTVQAQPNLHINYQGKLTDATGAAVPDGDYNLRFWLYDTAGAATTSAIWHESLGNASSTAVTITNGLFSVMLGSTSPLTSVDFNQTLYLGVEIGSSTPTPTWDGEMSPRKTLGTVPAAFEARQLDGLATTSFLRSDQADTMEATESSTLLSLIQNGTGAIFDAVNASTASVFKIFESGVVTIGTSTETGIATSTGLAVYNKDVEITIGVETTMNRISQFYVGGAEEGTGVEVVDNVAYYGDYSDGYTLINVDDPSNPSVIDAINPGYSLYDFKVLGNYAYSVLLEGNGLFITDISSQSDNQVGSITDGNNGATELFGPGALDVQGNYAYVAGYSDNGFQIVDISDPTNPIGLGELNDVAGTRLGGITDVVVRGNYAYLAASTENAVSVVDVSNPNSPLYLGHFDNGDGSIVNMSTPSRLLIDGNHLYVASGDALQVFDITNPTTLSDLGEVADNTNGVTYLSCPYGMEKINNYVIVGTTCDNGVQVIDVSDPADILGVSSFSVIDSVVDVDVFGGHVYAVDASGYLNVFSLPTLITPAAEIGSLVSNDIESDYVRVTQSLTTDGSLNVGTNAMIGGSLTITGTASSSLQAANTNPALTITSGYVGIGTTTPYADLSVAGDVALTGGLYDSTASLGTNGMVLQSTGSGVQWVATSSLNISSGGTSLFTDGGDITYLTSLTDVLAIGTTTDIATSTGLAVYNRDIEVLIGTGTPMQLVGNITNSVVVYPSAGGVYGDYVYLLTPDFGTIEVVDVSDPTNPVSVASISDGTNGADTLAAPTSIAFAGNYAYVTDAGDHGVQVLDISDPTNPRGVGSITDGNNGADELNGAYAIAIAGKYAYVASYIDDGVQVLDISDPTNPRGVGSITDGNNGADELNGASAIEVRGNYAYVVSVTDDGFQVLDISDPVNPIGLGEVTDNVGGFTVLDAVRDLAISGNYAYVAAGGLDNGVQVIDISDPNAPSAVDTITDGTNGATTLAGPYGIEVVGNYAFVAAADDNGVQVIDVSDPTNIIGAGSVVDTANVNSALSTPFDIFSNGEYIYVVSYDDNFGGFQILSLPTLTTPTASIGNLVSNDIETAYLTVTQALKADSLNINTNGMIGGSLTITGTASSSLIASNTNTALTITSGYIQMGTSTNATSGIQIGYGAICVDNDGACTASTTGRISSVSTYSGNSDLAETYFSDQPLEAGDIVALDGELSVQQANRATNNTIIGVVSTKPGVLLGFDDISTREGETAYPIALKGRIPVKVSTENGPINPGDQLMLSSIPGTAMKATGTGATIGIALEAFNPTDHDQYYSDTFINQYIDDLPSTEDAASITEQLKASTTNRIALGTTTRDRADDTEVQQGQIVMFVDLSYRYLDTNTSNQLASLMSAAPKQDQGTNEDETLFDRITTLAKSFVDGVLSVLEVKTGTFEVNDALCIDTVCIDETELQELIDSLETTQSSSTVPQDTVSSSTETVSSAEEPEVETLGVENEAEQSQNSL